mmetsp:Transcript_93729/g.244144  ORF Transcript_93729/g.244144 Transcript_93729/m.244144 type:complete len:260 (-) Transcript_93729:171-950(-)
MRVPVARVGAPWVGTSLRVVAVRVPVARAVAMSVAVVALPVRVAAVRVALHRVVRVAPVAVEVARRLGWGGRRRRGDHLREAQLAEGGLEQRDVPEGRDHLPRGREVARGREVRLVQDDRVGRLDLLHEQLHHLQARQLQLVAADVHQVGPLQHYLVVHVVLAEGGGVHHGHYLGELAALQEPRHSWVLEHVLHPLGLRHAAELDDNVVEGRAACIGQPHHAGHRKDELVAEGAAGAAVLQLDGLDLASSAGFLLLHEL